MKKIKINNYNAADYKKFKNHTKTIYNLNVNSKNNDYKWIEFFEEYIPYLDAIVRNPRRFIQSDELLVQIEKVKKVNDESIKHLAQHANLIQSIDNEDMPQPSKLLNVFKEETFDIYENRFIATLINRLYVFITMQYEGIKNEVIDPSGSEKSVTYKAKTIIGNEEYKSDLKISVKGANDPIDLAKVKERIDALYEVIVQFKKSDLMKQLDRAQPVRSPIRKTNAILKDPQLNKCLELWEILEQLENNVQLDTLNDSSYIDENKFVEDLTLTNYLSFCTLTNRIISEESELDDKSKNIFNDLIKIYIERDNIGIKNFRKELIQDLEMLCLQYERDYNELQESFEKFFNSFNY